MTTTIDTVRALARQRQQRGSVADHFKTEGMHRVGAGLYLRVQEAARGGLLKTWFHRYQYNGKARADSLGSAFEVSVENAAMAVDAAKDALAKGHDPRGELRTTAVAVTTFRDAAEMFLAEQYPQFANGKVIDEAKLAAAPKHPRQYVGTVRATYPVLGDLAMNQIRANPHIADALRPDWRRVPTTARHTRNRLWNVFDWAAAHDMRDDALSNPADVNTIKKLLRDNSKVKPKGHHAAMPYRDVPRFMRELASEEGIRALALQFTIRTLKRTSEVRLAHKTEIDLGDAVWIVPAARMKVKGAGRHFVPLSTGTVALLRPLLEMDLPGPYLFPARGYRKPLSQSAMLNLVTEGLGYTTDNPDHFTVHGFRSSFAEWQRVTRPQDRELRELQLAHLFGDDTERAYARDQLLEQRRPLVQAWDDFIDGKPVDNVVQLRAA